MSTQCELPTTLVHVNSFVWVCMFYTALEELKSKMFWTRTVVMEYMHEDGPIPQLQSEDPIVVDSPNIPLDPPNILLDPPNILLDPHQSVIVDYIRNIQALSDGNHGVTHYLQTLQFW